MRRPSTNSCNAALFCCSRSNTRRRPSGVAVAAEREGKGGTIAAVARFGRARRCCRAGSRFPIARQKGRSATSSVSGPSHLGAFGAHPLPLERAVEERVGGLARPRVAACDAREGRRSAARRVERHGLLVAGVEPQQLPVGGAKLAHAQARRGGERRCGYHREFRRLLVTFLRVAPALCPSRPLPCENRHAHGFCYLCPRGRQAAVTSRCEVMVGWGWVVCRWWRKETTQKKGVVASFQAILGLFLAFFQGALKKTRGNPMAGR